MFGLSTELITKGKFGHREGIPALAFRVLALCQSESGNRGLSVCLHSEQCSYAIGGSMVT